MFSTGIFIIAGVFALLGCSTVVGGFMLSLKNRRRRSVSKEKQAVEVVMCGIVIITIAALLALSSL